MLAGVAIIFKRGGVNYIASTCCNMIYINIDIVLHHATIKRYFGSFLTHRATLRSVGQKCVRPPPPPNFFDRYAYVSIKLTRETLYILKALIVVCFDLFKMLSSYVDVLWCSNMYSRQRTDLVLQKNPTENVLFQAFGPLQL